MIICCHAGKLTPETVASVDAFAPDASFIDTSANDFSYWETLADYWNCGEDLITIEQDIQITADTIPSFSACDREWCVFAYEGEAGHVGKLVYSLGCTRFRRELMERVSITNWPPMGWWFCDYQIARILEIHNVGDSHIHGEVKHHHIYQRQN